MFLFLLLWMCQWSCGAFEDKTQAHRSNLRNTWYGPSYQPRWWDAEAAARGAVKRVQFSYEGAEGPASWYETYSECRGRSQSPINIETESLKSRKTRKPLQWTNYKKTPRKMVVENSLHSIHLAGFWKQSSDIPYVTNGPFEKRYYFSQLHFHWGLNSTTGSEHTVNGKRFPLEMHVVHDRLTEDSNNVSEEGNSNHIIVISYMFEIFERDNPALKPILDATKEIRGYKKKKTNIKPFPIEDLVETFSGDYVTYKGSLTTPPCMEEVIWVISSRPMAISNRQLETLRRSVLNAAGQPFANYRPVQNLNSRNVYYVYC